MTKPIIINGVDVSRCEFFKTNADDRDAVMICDYKNVFGFPKIECQEYPNCYYKQLKKTQQELQQAMDNYVKATNYYEDKLAQIKRIIKGV